MNKKGTYKNINKMLGSPNQYDMQKNSTLQNSSSLEEIIINVTKKHFPKEEVKYKYGE